MFGLRLTFSTQLLFTRRFPGLMSLWRIRAEWRYLRPKSKKYIIKLKTFLDSLQKNCKDIKYIFFIISNKLNIPLKEIKESLHVQITKNNWKFKTKNCGIQLMIWWKQQQHCKTSMGINCESTEFYRLWKLTRSPPSHLYETAKMILMGEFFSLAWQADKTSEIPPFDMSRRSRTRFSRRWKFALNKFRFSSLMKISTTSGLMSGLTRNRLFCRKYTLMKFEACGFCNNVTLITEFVRF